MQKIYIMLTHTGTILSNIIKSYTKTEYSHVSIALDEDLQELYSFGRVNPYIAFVGGLVKESLTSGTFKRFKNTNAGVYELEVTDEQYEKIKNKIKTMFIHREEYKFNITGLFCVAINKKIKRPKTFYCAEFVKYVLESAGLNTSCLPEIIKPEDFKKLPNMKMIYKGKLKKYRSKMKKLKEIQKHISPKVTIPTRAVV